MVHQVIPGAINKGEYAYDVGSVDGSIFLACAVGYDVVILGADLSRIQLIHVGKDEHKTHPKISCCRDTGKIAVAYGSNIRIFEPNSLINTYGYKPEETTFNHQWVDSHGFSVKCIVDALVWSMDGLRLLIIQQQNMSLFQHQSVSHLSSEQHNGNNDSTHWLLVWQTKLSQPIKYVKYSPDGLFLAVASENDFSVRIFYQECVENDNIVFNYVLLHHPEPVIGFQWRSTGRYIPRKIITSSLVTWCKDNTSRIWRETDTAELSAIEVSGDGGEPAWEHNRSRTFLGKEVHLKKTTSRIVSKFKKIVSEKKRRQKEKFDDSGTMRSSPSLMTVYPIAHHSQGTVQFHLAATINAEIDCPLHSSVASSESNKRVLYVHWLNNKELSFNLESERLLIDALIKESQHNRNTPTDLTQSESQDKEDGDSVQRSEFEGRIDKNIIEMHAQNVLDANIEMLLQQWERTVDILYAICPQDGSLLVWAVDWLDYPHRQPMVSFQSRIPTVFPLMDAVSVRPTLYTFCAYEPLYQNMMKQDAEFKEYIERFVEYQNRHHSVYLLSSHDNGSLNLWDMKLDQHSSFSSVLNIGHIKRMCGHKHDITKILCHPLLPLALTSSQNRDCDASEKEPISELANNAEAVLWKTSPTSVLCRVGGVKEQSRLQNGSLSAFAHTCWIPDAFSCHQDEKLDCSNPSACFLTNIDNDLVFFQTKCNKQASNGLENDAKIVEVGRIIDVQKNDSQIKFVHIYNASLIQRPSEIVEGETTKKYYLCFVDEIKDKNRIIFYLLNVFQNEDNFEVKSVHLSTQLIKLHDNVKIVEAIPSFGFSSFELIMPVCPVPYHLITSCSDNSVMFWTFEPSNQGNSIMCRNWKMITNNKNSKLDIDGTICAISAAHHSRFAIAHVNNVNRVVIEIFQCESSGGVEWIKEDVIYSIVSAPDPTQGAQAFLHWIPTEDGRNILMVAVQDSIYFYTKVSPDAVQQNVMLMKEKDISLRRLSLRKESSILEHTHNDQSEWICVRYLKHGSNDETNRSFTVANFSRDGLLLVGQKRELSIYNQWELETKTIRRPLHNSNGSDRKQENLRANLQNMFSDVVDADSMLESLSVEGLFDSSYLFSPSLPQYHPKQLTALLNAGKTKRVKAILLNVLKSLKRHESSQNSGRRSSTKKRLSIDDNIPDELLQEGGADYNSSDYYEFKNFSPVPIYALLDVDKVKESAVAQKSGTLQNQDFSSVLYNSSLDYDLEAEFRIEDEEETQADVLSDDLDMDEGDDFSAVFTADHIRRLTELLTHTHLPGLSSVDQMHMLAIADTLSHFSGDVMDKLASGSSNNIVGTIGGSEFSQTGYASTANGIETVDECGLRYLMAMKQHDYLLICLPPKQKLELMRQGLSTSYVIWALHSETELEILKATPAWSKPTPTWEDMRSIGIAWWLKSPATLRNCLEMLAKAAFQANQDPLDASLFYLALRKKNILTHLFKTVRNVQMHQFFGNDFDDDHWKKVATKNAFVLMSKQRFRHAAAFFLLSGSLKDAVQTILSKCNDIQLAMVIIRVYETDLEKQQTMLKEVLCKQVLKMTTNEFDAARSNPDTSENVDEVQSDPFERSMAYWILKDYSRAASTLLEDAVNSSTDHRYISDVFNFYSFLRKHPLVVRQRLADSGAQVGSIEKFIAVGKNLENVILPQERRLFFQTAEKHLACGCPMLALEVLSRLPPNLTLLEPNMAGRRSFSISIEDEDIISDFGLTDSTDAQNTQKGPFDTSAQYLKIAASLRMLSEELSSVVNRFGMMEGNLSEKFNTWFLKEVEVVKNLCMGQEHSDNVKWILLRSFFLFSCLHSTEDLALSSAMTELALLFQTQIREGLCSFDNTSLSTLRLLPSPSEIVQRRCHDLLISLSEITVVPQEQSDLPKFYSLFKLGQALSSCMYQTLSSINDETLSTVFNSDNDSSLDNNSGFVSNSRISYKANQMLVECFVSISTSLFSFSMVSHNTRWLYRIASQTISRPLLNAIFGDVLSGMWIPPTQSIMQFFAEKGTPDGVDINVVDYDSEEEDDDDETEKEYKRMESPEKNSYVWGLMRLALIEQQKHILKEICSVLQYDVKFISARVCSIFQILETWSLQTRQQLVSNIEGCPIEVMRNVANSLANTDFAKKYAHIYQNIGADLYETELFPIKTEKRLWQLLIRTPHLQSSIFPHIFTSQSLKDTCAEDNEIPDAISALPRTNEVTTPFKILHRENENIIAFASNQKKPGTLVVSNGKELQEMDVSTAMLLYASPCINNNNKLHFYDIEHAEAVTESLTDDYHLEFENSNLNQEQSIDMLIKKPASGVRRLDSHPSESLYVSGANDGSIRVWEWGTRQPVLTARVAGQHARVNKVTFSTNGNKIAAVDGDGILSLWHICQSSADAVRKPFFSQRCNNKYAADVRFLGPSSSVLLTAGASTGDYNIAIWDTLLPQNRALVSSWAGHPDGASCADFLLSQQTIVSGGKHGEICFWDVRQRSLRTSIKAFDINSTVTALTVDNNDDFLVVGSSDGEIKIYSLDSTPQLLHEIAPEVSSKGGFSFSRPVGQSSGQGVVQLHLDNKVRLLSCGNDYTLRVHSLPLILGV